MGEAGLGENSDAAGGEQNSIQPGEFLGCEFEFGRCLLDLHFQPVFRRGDESEASGKNRSGGEAWDVHRLVPRITVFGGEFREVGFGCEYPDDLVGYIDVSCL